MSGFGQASPILGAAAGGTFGIALALLNCFFGYQLKKVWIALGCFALGGALGAGLGALLFQGNPLAWTGVALLLGVVFACLSFKLYLGGIFVLCFMLGWVITLPFLKLYGGWGALVCVAAGLTLGVLGIKFARPVLILATAVGGGLSAGRALAEIAAAFLPEIALGAAWLAAGLALAALGAAYQFKHTKSGG
ncbi:hypothetical protein [Allofournierella sp.]|uniref:hypothetical protein n=1 Tax=Allofournierella sp. TaxID=1940256 RepID=UPI003AF0F33D